MSATKVTKATLEQRIRGLIAGTQKHPPTGSLTVGGTWFGSVMTVVASCALELDALFTDGEIAVRNCLGYGVKSIVVIEVDEASLPVLQLV